MSELAANDYPGFLVEIKARIRQAQYRALRAVNAELVRLYWDIGESIHRKQETLGWGKSVVETLARDLQAEFPGQNGFSAANLWLMRQFYAEYRSRPILEPLVREISWAKNVLVMKRCKDDLEREFYLRATAGLSSVEDSGLPSNRIAACVIRPWMVTLALFRKVASLQPATSTAWAGNFAPNSLRALATAASSKSASVAVSQT